jgi:hypothetical protein
VSNLRLTAFVLIVVGCSQAVTEPPSPGFVPVADSDIRLVNATNRPFAYFAVAADLAPLLDPIPEMPTSDPNVQVVAAGSERPLGKIPGRAEAPEGGVAVYLYAISADGERARFTEVRLASGAELRRSRGRIVVRHFQ